MGKKKHEDPAEIDVELDAEVPDPPAIEEEPTGTFVPKPEDPPMRWEPAPGETSERKLADMTKRLTDAEEFVRAGGDLNALDLVRTLLRIAKA